MTTKTEEFLSDQNIHRYGVEGVVYLDGVFSSWVETLREGIEKLMANPSPRERSYTPADGTAPFFQDLVNWQRIPEFEDFVFNSPAGKIAAGLMGSNTARFFHDHVLVKEPGTSIVTPWHQDQPYYCTTGSQSASFWIPLDDVPKETALQCISGSHLWGKIHKPKRFDGTDLYESDTTEEMPDIDANRDKYDIVSWAMKPGDAIVFDFRIVHGAPANIGQTQRRRAFSARWVGDDAIFVDRKGKGSPPFDHLTLKTGEPLDGPDFPVVYTSQNAMSE